MSLMTATPSPPETAHSLVTCHLKCPAHASRVRPGFWRWDTHKAQCSSQWYSPRATWIYVDSASPFSIFHSLRATWVYVDLASPFSIFHIRSRGTVTHSLFFSPRSQHPFPQLFDSLPQRNPPWWPHVEDPMLGKLSSHH